MTFPLISPDWDFALWAVLIAIAGFGFWADSTRIGKQLSGVGIMLAVAMILGNLGVIPHAAPAYDVVWDFLVPAAVPLLLLKANLRRIIPRDRSYAGCVFPGCGRYPDRRRIGFTDFTGGNYRPRSRRHIELDLYRWFNELRSSC